jgi:drug/metabolite transporter (DMT)-like permease
MYRKEILYIILSTVSLAIMYSFVKVLHRFSVYQIVFFRSAATLLFTIPLIIKYKLSFSGNNKLMLFLRAVLGYISMFLFFMSINYLDLGIAVSIRYLSPFFALFFSFMILKETIKVSQLFFFLLSFLGVFIIKVSSLNISLIGLILALFSAITLGLVFVVIRKINNTENPLIIINYFMLFTFIFSIIPSHNNFISPNLYEFLLFFGLGFFSFLGLLFMTKAFQNSEVNILVPFKYSEIVFSIFIGICFFDESYSFTTLLGILLILIGLFCNLFFVRKF